MQTLIEQIIEINTLGWATFPIDAMTKVPMCGDWKGREANPFSVYSEETKYNTGKAYGVILRPQDLVVDIDPQNFKDGEENPWKRFKDDNNLLAIDTTCPVVHTGGGGAHLYFTKPPKFNCLGKIKGYPGLDIKAGGIDKGVYVLGPGSAHKSGNLYVLRPERPYSGLNAAREDFLALIERPVTALEEGTEGFSGGKQGYNRYVEWLKNYAIPTLIEEGGDPQRYRVACEGREYGITPAFTLKAMLEHYNPVCGDVWPESKLKEVVAHAYTYATGAVGKHDPALAFTAIEKQTGKEKWDEEADGDRKWDLDSHNQPKKTMRNCVNYLYIWPELSGCIKHNKFTGDLEVSGELPWHEKRGPTNNWTDTDVTLLKYYMSKKVKIEFNTEMLWGAIYTVGTRYAYHPVRKWIRTLKWDGEERLSNWLADYCGVAPNEYVAAVGRKTLVGAVARVFRPGCQFDYALILEGAQGIGKTTVCRILGGEWYGDIIVDPHGRDTVDAMRGKWVIELSEMEVTRRSDVQALKAFLSRNSDRTRLAYARAAQDFPRQCIFIGTVNPDDMGYLNDTTGNRRFWPVKCGKKIDMKGLAKVRDQLFAEAYVAFKKGEKTYLTGTVEAFAKIEQTHRESIDPWEDAIATWFESEAGSVIEITISQVWELALGGTIKGISRADQCRIGRILSNLGWRKTRPTRGGSRVKVYVRPVDKDTTPEELLKR